MSYFDDMEELAYAPFMVHTGGKGRGPFKKPAPPTEGELIRDSLSEREWAWIGKVLDNRKKIAKNS